MATADTPATHPLRRRVALVATAMMMTMALLAGTSTADEYGVQVWNGTKVSPGEHRSVAVLDLPDSPIPGECTGTLIDPRWILTAAHCLEDVPAAPIIIGMDGTDVDEAFGEVFTTRSHVVHPRYNSRTAAWDIALVQLPESSQLTPVTLADASDADVSQPGTRANVVGWGATDGRGRGVGTLREGFLNVVRDQECGDEYSDYRSGVMLCGDALESDACQGDSGGPLFSLAGEELVQIGVTSFGFDCDASLVGVYARVSAARDWIDEVIASGRVPKVVTDVSGQVSLTRIRRGEKVHFRVRLVEASSGAPLMRQKLELLRRRQGTSKWKVIDRATTSLRGRAHFADKPRRDMQYRIRHAATAWTTGVQTTKVRVRVR